VIYAIIPLFKAAEITEKQEVTVFWTPDLGGPALIYEASTQRKVVVGRDFRLSQAKQS
jgi:hypothetical protein